MAIFSGGRTVERRLTATSGRLRRARVELAQVTEELGAHRHDADDAWRDALVQGGTAKREAAQAMRHAERLTQARDRLQALVAELEREQDALLDRLPST